MDLSQLIAGPSATSMLAELGADVIKLETPNGDTSRRMGQSRKYGFSATFAAYNKGKRSIAIDLQSPEGLQAAQRLIASCDVIVEAFRPGVIERLGLSYEQVCEIKPDIIYLSFSGFGEDGPMATRPGVDLLVQGESGIMSITGEESGQPLKIGFTAVDAAAGFAVSKSILAGLVGKLRTGKGCRMRMSLMDVALYMQAVPLTEYLMSGVEPGRTGNKAPLGAPAEVFKTQDGTLIVSAYFPNQWSELCRILDLKELVEHPDFISNEVRIENRAVLHDLLQGKFLQKTSEEWKALFQATRIIYGDVLSYAQVAGHPQVQHNESLQEIAVEQGCLKSVSMPLRIDGQQRRQLNLPALGQHSAEILAEIGYAQEEIDDLRRRNILLS
ncbi:MAG: CoA transferase [Burkholderiaceae bacterium]|nr:CoA transferase [Burkholderiaceae bacterium]